MGKLTGVFGLFTLGCWIASLLYGFLYGSSVHQGFGLVLVLGVFGFFFLTILSGIIWAITKAVRSFRNRD